MRVDTLNAVSRAGELDKATGVQKTIPPHTGLQINREENGIDISEKMLIKTIEKANKELVVANRELEFTIHEKTKEIIVRVKDTETKEVIREIPSEKILDMIANILELAGILVDERR